MFEAISLFILYFQFRYSFWLKNLEFSLWITSAFIMFLYPVLGIILVFSLKNKKLELATIICSALIFLDVFLYFILQYGIIAIIASISTIFCIISASISWRNKKTIRNYAIFKNGWIIENIEE